MCSFERLLDISSRVGAVVGPFVEVGSLAGCVVTVGSVSTTTGEGICNDACTGAGVSSFGAWLSRISLWSGGRFRTLLATTSFVSPSKG